MLAASIPPCKCYTVAVILLAVVLILESRIYHSVFIVPRVQPSQLFVYTDCQTGNLVILDGVRVGADRK